MQADIGPGAAAPSGGGFLSSKRNWLLLAAVGGSAVGLVIFLSRRNAPAGGQGTAQYSAADLTNQSLANQILQFRGEQSQANQDISLQVKGGFDQTKTATDALTSLINILTGNVSGLAEDQASTQDLLQRFADSSNERFQGIGDMLQGIGRQQQATGDRLTGVGDMLQGIGNQNAGTRDALAGLGSQVAGIGGQLVNINRGITGAGGELNAINDTVSTGLTQGDRALQGVNDRLSFITRALTTLGQYQSLYGHATPTVGLNVPDAVGGLLNPIHIPRIDVGMNQRDVIGGSGALPALTGAQDAGDGNFQNWISTLYDLPTMKLPMVG